MIMIIRPRNYRYTCTTKTNSHSFLFLFWLVLEHLSSALRISLFSYARKKKKAHTKMYLTLATLQTVACQAPLSMGLSRQEYWSGCHFLLQGIFLTQESNPGLQHGWILYQILYPLSYTGSSVSYAEYRLTLVLVSVCVCLTSYTQLFKRIKQRFWVCIQHPRFPLLPSH